MCHRAWLSIACWTVVAVGYSQFWDSFSFDSRVSTCFLFPATALTYPLVVGVHPKTGVHADLRPIHCYWYVTYKHLSRSYQA